MSKAASLVMILLALKVASFVEISPSSHDRSTEATKKKKVKASSLDFRSDQREGSILNPRDMSEGGAMY